LLVPNWRLLPPGPFPGKKGKELGGSNLVPFSLFLFFRNFSFGRAQFHSVRQINGGLVVRGGLLPGGAAPKERKNRGFPVSRGIIGFPCLNQFGLFANFLSFLALFPSFPPRFWFLKFPGGISLYFFAGVGEFLWGSFGRKERLAKIPGGPPGARLPPGAF